MIHQASYNISCVSQGPKSIEEPEEKAIGRLGITYGVLRRLGFDEALVENCLRRVSGVELDEALQWVSGRTCSVPVLPNEPNAVISELFRRRT